MIVVLETFSSNLHNNDNYDYAVVKLEEEQAKTLARYMAMFKLMKASEPLLTEARFVDSNVECEFYPCEIWDVDDKDIMPEKIRKDLNEHGWVELDDGYSPPFTPRDAHAPDGTFIVVDEEGFHWHTLPSGSDITVDSRVLPVEVLQRLI